MTLVLDDGLGFRAGMDEYTSALVPYLDGTRRLDAAIATAAESVGLERGDLQTFSRGALAVVREMLALGFVVSDSWLDTGAML
jgi:hypothetical protein